MMDIADFKKHILPLNGRLFHYAYLMLKDKSEAEDAVQEVCLKLWKIRSSLEKYNSIEAFAIKVTRNWCLDRIKAKKPVYVENYNSWYDINSEENDPHRKLENNDRMNLLHKILGTMSEHQRQIIQLRDFESLEFEEISEIMDMNINAVRVNLSRARNKIREEMLKYESNGQNSNSTAFGKIL